MIEFDAYICGTEEEIDKEFGCSRGWEELSKSGDMPEVYYHLQSAINERERVIDRTS